MLEPGLLQSQAANGRRLNCVAEKLGREPTPLIAWLEGPQDGIRRWVLEMKVHRDEEATVIASRDINHLGKGRAGISGKWNEAHAS